MQSRDGLVSSPRRNPALQSFLCTRGFPTPASLSFQSWFPLIDVQRPGQSPGPLPGWGPPPGSCPAPRLAHLFRDVIGIIGLWRTQGCHLPLGSIWNTAKAGQHGPCALIPRARDLRGESWEQSGRWADRCHCGDLEGGLRVTTGQRGECWIVSSLLSLVGKAHAGNNQREAQPSSPPWCPLSTVSPWVTQPVLCPLPTDSLLSVRRGGAGSHHAAPSLWGHLSQSAWLLSFQLRVPCVLGNPNTASSLSLSRSSLASSALAKQSWSSPWISLEKIRVPLPLLASQISPIDNVVQTGMLTALRAKTWQAEAAGRTAPFPP
ncbi:uncharacterized protein LOC114903520 [Monodon monoceros]|uniref:uncharacterized protein LOC114903520 n=1 Tax=Monodon monoceros TaxID=40151 RepID=UPI0010F5E7FC|nr:uncharacterized protein LOC114903520 [Monodon monoceros]